MLTKPSLTKPTLTKPIRPKPIRPKPIPPKPIRPKPIHTYCTTGTRQHDTLVWFHEDERTQLWSSRP